MNSQESKLVDSFTPFQIGDQEFKAHILTDKDFGDLNQYIKCKYIENVKKNTETLDEDDQKEFRAIALEEVNEIVWGTKFGHLIIFQRLDGLLHLGHQMIRKAHPNLLFRDFELIAKGEKRQKGSPKLSKEEKGQCTADSVRSIGDIFMELNIPKEAELAALKKGDTGGSPTENGKSDEN